METKARFPLTAKYDPLWVVENLMGPNVLWLCEHLAGAMSLRPGMRVLDLGCGKAVSSIFLAKEFGVTVIAADLWIKAEDNAVRITAAGVADRVTPVHAEAHALPFAQESFDAIVSLDAYHYFGTDDLYIGTITKFLKPGGLIGIVVPGVTHEITAPPDHLKPWWEWDFVSFHSPDWWRHHWAKTSRVMVETADWMEGGHDLWLEWCRYTAPLMAARGEYAKREGDMLEADVEQLFGFVRMVGRKV